MPICFVLPVFTGTVSSNEELTGLMEVTALTSALSPLDTRSSTSLAATTTLVLSGTIPTLVRRLDELFRVYFTDVILGTQYCDGLRGPLVVYDNNDPYRNLYDIDDGELTFLSSQMN